MSSRTAGPHDVRLSRVATEDIDKAWGDVEPYLRMACTKVQTFHTPESLHKRLTEDKCSLWVITRNNELIAAAVSSAVGDVALIEVLGGKYMTLWKEQTLAEFEAMAKANGMRELAIDGREGWLRALPGYRKVSISMRKVL